MSSKLANAGLGKKLTGSFICVAVLCVIVGAGGLVLMGRLNANLSTLYRDRVLPLEQLKAVSDMYQVDIVDAAHKVSGGLLAWPDARKRVKDARATIETKWQAFMSARMTPEEQALANEAAALKQKADAQLNQLDEILASEDFGALGLYLASQLYPAVDPVATKVSELVTLQLRLSQEEYESAQAAYRVARVFTWLLMLAAMAIALCLGYLLTRHITGRLARVAERADSLRNVCVTNLGVALEGMAKGDFEIELHSGTVPLEIDSQDEIGRLAATMNGMIARTQATIDAARAAQGMLGAVIAETDRLIAAAGEGRLSERGEAERFEGGYRRLVAGINATIDAVLEPVNESAAVLERLAARDLTARMAGSYRGDHALMKDALNGAAETLDDVLAEVAQSSEQVASASEQISRGSQLLAEGSSEQASSLEEVSSSLQELASMARQNASNAREAQTLAEGARGSAGRGVEGMRELSAAVERIKASSDATAKIVRTIDEIAFQTNLLALNAAVEAARAGDAGRGFAVVAEEVRSLAMRSAEAARNTASLIEESVRNSESGVALNGEVLRNFEEIAEHVNRVGEVMSEIAAASEQQSDGVTQINGAVDQMNAVTQQVAANSEESASAAQELGNQAERMKELIGSFDLTRAEAIARAAAASRGAPATRSGPGNGHRSPAATGNGAAMRGARPRAAGTGVKRAGNGHGARFDAAAVIPLDDDDLEVLEAF